MTDGAAVLGRVFDFVGRFVAYPSDYEQVAHTLWIAHTHAMGAWESTPRIAFLSPEPASGKTRALEVTELLVPNPVEAVNVTPAYLFRKVGDPAGAPTILYDEIDTVFGPKAKDNEEIRGLLNAGHRRGAVAGRCVVKGKTVETEEIPAYCAVALAGLGGLPDTILTRSVIIGMKRRAPGEQVEPFRRRLHEPEGHAIRDDLARWAATVVDDLSESWPLMPAEIEDRDADVWEPLLAIAKAAGPEWEEWARVTAVTLVTLSKESTPSLGIRLLRDIRAAFVSDVSDVSDSSGGEPSAGKDFIATTDLLSYLHSIEEAPWGDLRGKPLDARGLSTRLRQYGISRTTVRIGTSTPKGYRRADFHDAWARYLPDLSSLSPESETSETSETGTANTLPLDWRDAGENAGCAVCDSSDVDRYDAGGKPLCQTHSKPRGEAASDSHSGHAANGRGCASCGDPLPAGYARCAVCAAAAAAQYREVVE